MTPLTLRLLWQMQLSQILRVLLMYTVLRPWGSPCTSCLPCHGARQRHFRIRWRIWSAALQIRVLGIMLPMVLSNGWPGKGEYPPVLIANSSDVVQVGQRDQWLEEDNRPWARSTYRRTQPGCCTQGPFHLLLVPCVDTKAGGLAITYRYVVCLCLMYVAPNHTRRLWLFLSWLS